MEVILLEGIEKLGSLGDVVRVKNGYARNFLLPNKKALRASKENLKLFEERRAQLEERNARALTRAREIHDQIDGKSFTLIRQASETGQLYGSVSSRDIVALLLAETGGDHPITRGQVLLDEVIKTLGIHHARIRLHPEAVAGIRLNVARTEEDAEGQLEALTTEEQARQLSEAADTLFEEGASPVDMANQLAEEAKEEVVAAEAEAAEATGTTEEAAERTEDTPEETISEDSLSEDKRDG